MTNELCEQIRIAAAALEDGETASLSNEEIEAHVSACPACRDAIATLADLRSRFQGAKRVGEDPQLAAWVTIRERRTSAPGRAAPQRNRAYWIGGVGVALLFLLAGIGRQVWRATFSDETTTPAATVAPGDRPASDSVSAKPSATAPPSATQSPAVLRVSIASKIFDEPSPNVGAPAPFSEEAGAKEFALAVVEEVVERDGGHFLPLKLTEVFVGRLPAGRFLAEDSVVVRMECSLPPQVLGKRSQVYAPGSSVVVYLSHDEAKGWQVNHLVRMAPGSEKYWRERLQTFADVMLAPESPQPEKRFRELLRGSKGEMEFTVYHALARHPHAAARPAVRELWREAVERNPIDSDQVDTLGSMSLLYLMRNLREDQMLDEVLEHALRQKPGFRGGYFWELAIQADCFENDARRRLKGTLQKFLADLPSPEMLDPVKDALTLADISATKQSLKHLETLTPKP